MEEKTHIFAPDLGMALLGAAGCATLPEDNPAGLADPARGSWRQAGARGYCGTELRSQYVGLK